MNHNDESYAAMLLVTYIRPDREELVNPMTSEEWHALKRLLRDRGMRMGDLIGMDMSALMMKLGLSDEEAYREYLLLNRMLPMSISLEKLAMRGIEAVTYSQSDYPERLRERLLDSAPAMLYFSGRPEVFKQDAIAILGAVKPLGGAKDEAEKLVKLAVDKGYVVVTDGTMGISRFARDKTIALGGKVIEVLPGELSRYVDRPEITAAIAMREDCVVSTEHPDKPCTLSSAQSRNKIIYGLCQAAFVFGVERNSGAVWSGACETLKKHWCPRLYAWDTPLYKDNAQLIQRGATAFDSITPELFESMRAVWLSDSSKQICMFDNEEPL